MFELTAARLKEIRAIHSPHLRKKSTKMLIEGARTIATMLQSGITPDYLVVCPALLTKPGKSFIDSLPKAAEVFTCGASKFREVSETEHSQGILAIADRSALPDGEAFWSGARLIVYLDRLSDPGNLGTILRTAAAFNVDIVALSPGSAEIINPKVLRASAGAVFLQPTICGLSPETLIAKLKSNNIALYGADANAVQTLDRLNLAQRVCVAIGSEASGLSPTVREACNELYAVRISSRVESLNAAIASAISISRLAERLKTV